MNYNKIKKIVSVTGNIGLISYICFGSKLWITKKYYQNHIKNASGSKLDSTNVLENINQYNK